MINRYLVPFIVKDLREKMVFIGGARQVGKTTMAKGIGSGHFSEQMLYLNWDFREDRKAIIDARFPSGKKIVVFDEIHKYKNWKNYVKGLYDKFKGQFKILVTGSSRLDIFRKGGDSLLGRYHYYRLHPLSLAEVADQHQPAEPLQSLNFSEPGRKTQDDYRRLLMFGGFPEIWLRQDENELRRWHNERTDRLIREDVRDLESVRDLSGLQVLVELVRGKAGSRLSLNSLSEDLKATHKTISHWVDILEKFYYLFRVYPYQSTKIRSLRKEPKVYLWDWSELDNQGHKIENLSASHLLKFCHFLCDSAGHKAELFYLRDKEQREVDFLVTLGQRPWFCVEVKKAETEISPALKYFKSRLNIPFAYQVVNDGEVDFIQDGIRVLSAAKFLTGLV